MCPVGGRRRTRVRPGGVADAIGEVRLALADPLERERWLDVDPVGDPRRDGRDVDTRGLADACSHH